MWGAHAIFFFRSFSNASLYLRIDIFAHSSTFQTPISASYIFSIFYPPPLSPILASYFQMHTFVRLYKRPVYTDEAYTLVTIRFMILFRILFKICLYIYILIGFSSVLFV